MKGIEKVNYTNLKIIQKIYLALENLKAKPELLAIIGSWKDTLPDQEVLEMFDKWLEDQNYIIRFN